MLAVAFEPPYWGVLRFELSPDGSATELRVTQRGFEGNEDWLADFRGGWGSFNDRLAVLCEIGATAAPRRIEATLAAERTLEPGEVAGALAQLGGPRAAGASPYWYADGGRITLVVPGADAGNGYRLRRDEACDALCVELPPGADLEAARASLLRSLPRRGWTAAGPLRASVDPAHPEARLRALPALPPGARRRSRALRARVRARVLRARPARLPPPTSLPAARSRSPAGRTRARSTRRSRASPKEAVARFWRLRLEDGVLTADWEGNGWTAGPQPRHEHLDVRRGRPHRTAHPALRPVGGAHGRRMTEAWVTALRGGARRPRAHASRPSSPPWRATPRT